MAEYTFQSTQGSWATGIATFSFLERGIPAGKLTLVARGAIAETPLGSLSFRPDGLDPVSRSVWRRRFGHDATILDLARNEVVASLTVTPFRKELSMGKSVYRWSVSFLMREASWTRDGQVVATIHGERIGRDGRVSISSAVSPRESIVLAFFGVYLFAGGRAG